MTLVNSWQKLLRYRHHERFLQSCLSKELIPKGLLLKFNLELDKDNMHLKERCKEHCQSASLAIIKDDITAVKDKIKSLQKDLEIERRKSFEDFNRLVAERMWWRIKREMRSYDSKLVQKETHKLSNVIPFTHKKVETSRLKAKGRNRRFWHNMRTNGLKKTEVTEQSTQAQVLPKLPTLEAINLTSTVLTKSEKGILAKGPFFCPMPKDINWMQLHDNLEKFE